MNDKQAVQFLIDRAGSIAAAAHALGGIGTKRLLNWRRRGISARYRPAFLIVANAYGAALGPEWLTADVPKRIVGPTPKPERTSNGRASPRKRKAQVKVEGKGGGKRSRPQQRRRASRRRPTGRGVSAVAL
jgi:hypothetical protein